ncbi:chitin-binding protein [Micromonospora pattaloongensis]|uniref:Chitin-binding protein n=1 Tax=Micromonospora pattaloongensis TaxID=405436 RepID=A0A1H3RS98_9ACTN|nr:lytic polysaccharide monooxygenase [Micromonospora pattaloongensis]SDZ28128.1 chitin-binding protein [Micromonospora pattaloongensis]
MTVRRTLAALGLAPVLLLAAAPTPARAHGAMTDPVSRAAACASEQRAGLPVCRAAVAAGGGHALADWDNLRIANVRGRDRERIPDGQLCSGGLDRFAGLDLARGDWPTTRLRAGSPFTFRYGIRIPHRGTFRLYLTRDGYDPARPLRWSDLDVRPFLTATDPALRSGAYTMTGTLPARTGRHVIYTIWQNSDTPDTYYSCSDVVLTGAGGAAPTARPSATLRATASASPSASAAASPVVSTAATPAAETAALDPVARIEQDPVRRLALPAAASLVLVAVAVAVALRRRRRA